MKLSRQVGTASECLLVYIQDATVSTGAGLANIVASSVSFGWYRDNMLAVSTGTCTTGTLGTYGVSSLVQMNSTAMLGWYQFCPPDSVFVDGGSVALHLYGAPNMAPVPMEIELTKTDNQSYLSTQTISTLLSGVKISSGVGVSSFTLPVGVSSFAIRVGVSTAVGVSSGTWIAAVSSMQTEVGVSTIVPVGVSSPAGVSSFTLPVGVSSFGIRVGVSSLVSTGISTDAFSQIGFRVSTGVGVSSFTSPVGVSSFTLPVGVSSFGIPVGVSTAVLLDATYGPAGRLSTDVVRVLGQALTGTGTSSDPWGP